MSNRKRGEQEAIAILESLGIVIDKEYHDDNSQKSMPDIRCEDGRFIEVTHTFHNNAIATCGTRFDRLSPNETWEAYSKRHLDAANKSREAWNRISNRDYETDDTGKLTEAGLAQFRKDAKKLKEHSGYDVMEMDFSKQFSEFGCDHPSINYSTDNILREICNDKAERYPNGDVDLFIFATEEEFLLLKELLPQVDRNAYAMGFVRQVSSSPFPKVYVCEWSFIRQEYNTKDPQLVIFYRTVDGLKWELRNIRDEQLELI